MRDSEMVASIVAGDADALAAAYDRYADPLYRYCRSMLGDPADAADAVQDTFVVAASRLADLRDPERLRVWLYAVARNECLRIPRATRTTSALAATDDSADAGDDAGRAGAAAGSPQGTAGPPAGLRAHTLALAADQDPGAVAHRAAVLSRAGAFGRDGFPRPPHGPAAAPGRRTGAGGAPRLSPRSRAAAAAGAVLAVVIAAGAFALDGGTQHGKPAAGQPPGSLSVPASAGASAVTATRPNKDSVATATPAQAPARSATPALSAAASTSAASSSSAPATPAPPRSPSPVPTTASPTPTPTPSSKPTPGTLEVWPASNQLWIWHRSATIWLTAQGGPVTWRITVSAGPGSVSVSPSSGTLAAGKSVQVTVTASDSASGERVTVYPGGTVFTIMVGWGHTS